MRRLTCSPVFTASRQPLGKAPPLYHLGMPLKSRRKCCLPKMTICTLRYLLLSNPALLQLAHPPLQLSLNPSTRRFKNTTSVRQTCLRALFCQNPRIRHNLRMPPQGHLRGFYRISISVSESSIFSRLFLTSSDLFFQEWQPLLPVLHRPTFLRVYEQYLAGPDAGNWQSNKQAIAQLFLIFEISALSSSHQTKTHTPSYENQWRRALFSTSAAPTLSVIQCQILAQLCYLLRADYTSLARHRGVAVGMCHELGLHQGHKYHALSTFEAETRKRIFWCQYVLDKYVNHLLPGHHN